MGDMEWTNDRVIRLMKELEKRPELWDAKNELYRVQSMKYESWSALAKMFDCDIGDLRKKLNSLFASHRREKQKVRAGSRSYWFLYPYMSFLPSHIDDSGNSHASRISVAHASRKSSRPQPPVKERPRPSSATSATASEASSEPEDDVVIFAHDDEEDEEDSLLTATHSHQVLIKQEPEKVRAKPRLKPTHRPRIVKPLRRRFIKDETRDSTTISTLIDARLNEAVRLLRRSEMTRKMDECDSFAKYIADSLRKHDERTQSMIKQAINNILFEQEMKKYNSNQQQYVVLTGIDENPLVLSDQEVHTEK